MCFNHVRNLCRKRISTDTHFIHTVFSKYISGEFEWNDAFHRFSRDFPSEFLENANHFMVSPRFT